jgi:ribosomal protein L29
MKKEEKLPFLIKIVELKKELTMLRIKSSSGETIPFQKAKSIKKEIARIYTKLNSKK